jgi:Protein of unknown function (DUF4054)
MSTPNYCAWLGQAWGMGQEYWCAGYGVFQGASNFVFGTNPLYYLDDFFSIYPKFFGLSTPIANASLTTGSTTVAVPSTYGLAYGQFVQAIGLPPGTVITGVGMGSITVNNPALATTANATLLNVYEQPPIPVAIIQLYINLASSSLVQERWGGQWYIGVALYAAHYCTLYARSDSTEVATILQTVVHGETPQGAIPGAVYTVSSVPPGGVLQALTKNGKFLVPGADYTLSTQYVTLTVPTVLNDVLWATWPTQQQVFTAGAPTGAQIAAQGLAGGIQTSKSVGDVSVGYQTLESLKQFGAWQLTLYGQQLVTMAKAIGAGPAWIY